MKSISLPPTIAIGLKVIQMGHRVGHVFGMFTTQIHIRESRHSQTLAYFKTISHTSYTFIYKPRPTNQRLFHSWNLSQQNARLTISAFNHNCHPPAAISHNNRHAGTIELKESDRSYKQTDVFLSSP